ncbi:MAG: hypothetical protein EP330_06220 [Deltaproteobacteria bacterium]|nr:MAG: hypothetical protein EP330_06220 [Deltaproteobacteria bacterium]
MFLFLLFACGSPPNDPPKPAATPPKAEQVESLGFDADLERALAFYATRPEMEQPHGKGFEVPSGVPDLSAESCGICHGEIYEEWKLSTHAHAWIDPQLQEEMKKSANRWLCENCHTPLLVQQANWTVGLSEGDVEAPQLVPNEKFDAKLQEEGITCASCHVRDGVIEGPGLPDSVAAHPVKADARFQSEAICLRCHQAVAEYPGKSFVCTFNTGKEWSEGPYADEQSCLDCHMPTVERPVALGGPVRKVRSHYWRGAGIPKVAGVHPPPSANPPGLGLDASWTPAELSLTMTNANAGHMLPTGDPERWVQIDVRFETEAGEAVGEPIHYRIGQTWEWYPAPKKLNDNRLAPKEARTETLAIPEGAARAVIEASSHRISKETAEYHHLDAYPRSLLIHRITVSAEGVDAEDLPKQ